MTSLLVITAVLLLGSGREPLDMRTFLTAPEALVLVALAALALPALRASRVDPVRTLREE
jgi:hypothetical protein